MNLPGFTAETTVYKSSGSYRGTSVSASPAGKAGTILPQLRRQMKLLQCLQGCSYADSPDYCADLCYWNEFTDAGGGENGGGGGPQQVCTPGCGPCRAVPGEPGRTKTCVKRNCDTYDVRCH